MDENLSLKKEDVIHSMVEAAKNPQNAVRIEVTNTVSDKLKDSPEVKERVSGTADRVIDACLTTVENEAQSGVHEGEAKKLEAYFLEHKEELTTAGIDKFTYMEDMERAVKWHRKCAKIHWAVFGWWMTLIRTFFQKAKPFKWLLNTFGVLLNIALIGGVIYGIIWLINR